MISPRQPKKREEKSSVAADAGRKGMPGPLGRGKIAAFAAVKGDGREHQ